MQWVSDQEQRHASVGRESSQELDILASSPALERIETLSRDAEIVADGESNALLPKVERQYARRFAQTRPSTIRLYFLVVLGSESEHGWSPRRILASRWREQPPRREVTRQPSSPQAS